jgi:hypothetical protein
VLEATEAKLQEVKRDLQEQQGRELMVQQEAVNYKHMYEQSLENNIAQMEELTKCRDQHNQLMQQENARFNEMVSL